MQKVVISLINFNGNEKTKTCLASIEKLKKNKLSVQVVVIDNNSRDPLSLEKKYGFPIHLIYNKINKGFTGGQNDGILYSLSQNADAVLILNNDTILDEQSLSTLVNTLNKDENIGIVVPKIYFAAGSEFHKNRYTNKDLGKVIWYAGGHIDWKNIIATHRGVDVVDNESFNAEIQTDFATGCCMLVRSDVFKKVGLLDDRYFLYYEDNDFSQRVLRAGYKIIFQPKAVIWHENAGSAGGSGSLLQDYFITRNRLLFGMTYGNLRAKQALIRESIKLLIFGRKTQKKGIKDFYLKRFGKGTYAS